MDHRRPMLGSWLSLLLLLAPINALSISRSFPAATFDAKHNRIVFAGGASSTSNVTADVFAINLEAFNRSDVQVTSLGQLASPVADATLVHTGDGTLQLIGGTTNNCAGKVQTQQFNVSSDSWNIIQMTGTVPTIARTGARAAYINGQVLYFGGRSVSGCSSSQYYYNTLYTINSKTNNWTSLQDASPPIAQADMSLTPLSDGSFLLVGGESAGSGGKASWVGMSQYALYGANSSAWSYLSPSVGSLSVTARSGHSAAFNGSHTFIYGGSVGAAASTPSFISIKLQDGALQIAEVKPAGLDFAPPSGLYGHAAVMTTNSIMVMAFGMVGSANSTTFNNQIYLYDTVANTWLNSYDPTANPSKNNNMGLPIAAVAGIISGIGILVIACGVLALFCLRRRKQRQHQVPFPRLDSYASEAGYSYQGKEMAFRPADMRQDAMRAVSLPPWAALHACRARSASPTGGSDKDHSINQVLDGYTDEQAEYNVQDRMVQIAMPASPRFLTFTAPKLQLRVVNPSIESGRSSLDLSYPEMVEIGEDGTGRAIPLSITDEDDLEHLRITLATTPIISDSVEDFQNQLAGLGLVLREEDVLEPSTGTLRRVRTLSKKSKVPPSSTPPPSLPALPPFRRSSRAPRLSVVSTTSGLGLESVIDQVMSPAQKMPLTPFTERSSPGLSYSPYLDSPRLSDRAPSPTHPQRSPSNASSRRSEDLLRYITSPSPDLSLKSPGGQGDTPSRMSSMHSQTYTYTPNSPRAASPPPQHRGRSPARRPEMSPSGQSAVSIFSDDASLLPKFEPTAVPSTTLQTWMRQGVNSRGTSFRYPARPVT
ncbi:hypothetical protein BCR37DRAFT_57142 [Protomyces lactucae-debilis]|uniref:Galactose oxidase n=1 Tax=Protomyces lactucae-debilis TaxID=2754530 RepID=A0A1Y2FAJ5_PROLT|nr:uncharacterized protein BCR37DRAFT_57142 [Protomyces lactucae-debilis]ORY80911.1 hypothetical protein BCR37DRAFT_57142 [Protomyces lactucae-debilis]